ncbi:MAG: MmcQ/YjbR family DNA-binding protein [Bacteroidales bacterium]|nr:MmcQ/YjbR family DNA-binding protein [Bacteroidales bacterium]
MNVEDLRNYCLSKKAVTESTPFDDVTLVFKVAGKMFAIIPLDETDLSITLKCDPEKAISLRERYPAVKPGYHTSKIHWNTVSVDGTVDRSLIVEWIDHSYEMVVLGLTKKQRLLLDA